jgi:hypothetical protein
MQKHWALENGCHWAGAATPTAQAAQGQYVTCKMTSLYSTCTLTHLQAMLDRESKGNMLQVTSYKSYASKASKPASAYALPCVNHRRLKTAHKGDVLMCLKEGMTQQASGWKLALYISANGARHQQVRCMTMWQHTQIMCCLHSW